MEVCEDGGTCLQSRNSFKGKGRERKNGICQKAEILEES